MISLSTKSVDVAKRNALQAFVEACVGFDGRYIGRLSESDRATIRKVSDGLQAAGCSFLGHACTDSRQGHAPVFKIAPAVEELGRYNSRIKVVEMLESSPALDEYAAALDALVVAMVKIDDAAKAAGIAPGEVAKVLSFPETANIRAAGVIPPAGQVFPTAKPFVDGKAIKLLTQRERHHDRFADFANRMAVAVLGRSITVQFSIDEDWNRRFAGSFGPDHELHVSNAWLTTKIGAQPSVASRTDIIDFLIHEFGHHGGADHLDQRYHESLTRIGARTAIWLAAHSGLLSLLDG